MGEVVVVDDLGGGFEGVVEVDEGDGVVEEVGDLLEEVGVAVGEGVVEGGGFVVGVELFEFVKGADAGEVLVGLEGVEVGDTAGGEEVMEHLAGTSPDEGGFGEGGGEVGGVGVMGSGLGEGEAAFGLLVDGFEEEGVGGLFAVVGEGVGAGPEELAEGEGVEAVSADEVGESGALFAGGNEVELGLHDVALAVGGGGEGGPVPGVGGGYAEVEEVGVEVEFVDAVEVDDEVGMHAEDEVVGDCGELLGLFVATLANGVDDDAAPGDGGDGGDAFAEVFAAGGAELGGDGAAGDDDDEFVVGFGAVGGFDFAVESGLIVGGAAVVAFEVEVADVADVGVEGENGGAEGFRVPGGSGMAKLVAEGVAGGRSVGEALAGGDEQDEGEEFGEEEAEEEGEAGENEALDPGGARGYGLRMEGGGQGGGTIGR